MPATASRSLSSVRETVWESLAEVMERAAADPDALPVRNQIDAQRALSIRWASQAEITALVSHLLMLQGEAVLVALRELGVLLEGGDSQ